MATSSPLIIDCDPGIDDALALLLAAARPDRLDLLGVTTVAGNRPVHTTTANARAVLQAAGRAEVPVFEGAERPLSGLPARCNLVHGEDGLGGVRLPPAEAAPAARAAGGPGQAAVDFLVRSLHGQPEGTIELVAMGPLTNLALAERQAPGVLRRCRTLRIMGGAVRVPGNVTPHAEFNFHADALAAREVLASGARIVLFGLDVTSQAAMPAAWIDGLGSLGTGCAGWAQAMLVAYAAQDPLLHDVCPVAHLLRPSLFEGEALALEVEDEAGSASEGQVRALPDAGSSSPAVKVMSRVDMPALLVLMQDALARLP